jgi:hypothetical protein
MNFLFVKTKGKTGTFRKVLSDKTIYENIPSFDDNRPYNDELRLHNDQWFILEQFSQKPYAPQLVTEAFNAAVWSQIDRVDYEKIDFLVSVQSEGNQLMFQNITSSLILKRQSWLSLDEQPSLLNRDHVLVIHNTADAYYLRDVDRLYFQRLSAITSIFPGINELYNEATDAEVENALQLDLLDVAPNFTKEQVKTANRRKIREAMDMYNNYTPQQKAQLSGYLQKYCPGLTFDANSSKFSVTDEKELTQLLNGLCQRYYTTEISNEKRVALTVEGV